MNMLDPNVYGGLVVISLLTGIGFWLGFSKTIQAADVPERRKQIVPRLSGALLLAWFIGIYALGAGGFFQEGFMNKLAYTALIPVAIGVGLLFALPNFNKVTSRMPQYWLLGISSLRAAAGFMFLTLGDLGLAPTEFAAKAGYGDVAVGLLAAVAAYWYYHDWAGKKGVALTWNLLGLADAISAMLILPTVPAFVASGAPGATLDFLGILASYAVPIFVLLQIFSIKGLLLSKSA